MLVSPRGRLLVTGDGEVLGGVDGGAVGVRVVPPGAVLVCAVNVMPGVETRLVPDSDPRPQAGSDSASGTTAANAITAAMATKTPASAVRSDLSVESDIGRHDT